ncbi:unnamed protein product [Meloidogyne enterolobii]|uniref:Uncharacterized protein n=1 Tax=Meloidogyne enterolobii TaxID=390850 RepID=A0ACB0YN77_MELEN
MYADFVPIKNKWSKIVNICCQNNCINTDRPIGNCIKGNGFGNLINEENIKYLGKNGGMNNSIFVDAENPYNKPQISFNYSLYYFEIKCIFENGLDSSENGMSIGLENLNSKSFIRYSPKGATILTERFELFKLSTSSWNNNDIFGCGLVYPPNNKLNEGEFPYVFFTQNGKQIGKGILLIHNFDAYKPYVDLKCCSIETNFGNDLETKPFKYEISTHLILKEFY